MGRVAIGDCFSGSSSSSDAAAKMKVVGLVSGGKDSTYNMMQCIASGHEIVALANLYPKQETEIDSYMYQSVGFEAITLIAEAMGLPLFRKETEGRSVIRGKTYTPNKDDEVEDLYELLLDVKNNVQIDAVSVGAILSDYQRVRIENVCIRLGLVPLAYLWQRDQKELLEEMIRCQIDAIIIKVAAIGLEPSRHLFRSLRLVEPHLSAMNEKYGINVCGEGGEYETLTLDCPLFNSRIVVDEMEVVLHSQDTIASVAFLKLKKIRLELKLPPVDLYTRMSLVPLKNSDGYVTDESEEAVEKEEISNEDESSEYCMIPNKIFEQSLNHSKSGNGWVWIGGIRGESSDPYEAIKEAMENLKCALQENGHCFEDLTSISMFISDMSQYVELNRLYCEILHHVNPPTRACVQVPLPKNCPVIMEAVSWSQPMASVSGDVPVERHTMHVQSISHWAPASIGPYSQAVRIGNFIHLAGQISLVPGSMQMVKGGIGQQCHLSLRHIGRLIRAIDSNMNLRNVVQGICYVTNAKYIEHARKQWEEKTNNAIVDYVVVSGLPRNATVEWHVWAHRHNNLFEYEETGKCIDQWSISIYRRWNYENNVAAIVCHVENTDDKNDSALNEQVITESIEYTLSKLKLGHENDNSSVCNIKVFYSVNKTINIDDFSVILNRLRETVSLTYTIVPVVLLKTKQTYLSVCGVRNQ